MLTWKAALSPFNFLSSYVSSRSLERRIFGLVQAAQTLSRYREHMAYEQN